MSGAVASAHEALPVGVAARHGVMQPEQTGEVSHNLAGQRLGRKGRDTRERILAAALQLIEGGGEEPFTLGAVARRAGLALSSLYNYFADQTELVLGVLQPIMATAEDAYLAQLREPWSDNDLSDRTRTFVRAYHDFWARHSGLLHLRNSMADQLDVRMIRHRVDSTRPVIALIACQMRPGGEPGENEGAMATLLMTGLERSVTHATDRRFAQLIDTSPRDRRQSFHRSNARLLELAIRDMRENG